MKTNLFNGTNEIQVKKDNNIPYYVQVENLIKNAIIKNTLGPGIKIDNENELASLFDVSRPTIRQAMKELEIKGYIKKIKGSGTYISERKLESDLFNKFLSASEDLKNHGIDYQNEVIKAEQLIAASIQDNTIIYFEPNDIINYVERIRYVNNESYNFTQFYVPDKYSKDFYKANLKEVSCFEIWRKQYQFKIDKLTRILSAVTGDYNKRVSKLLGIKANEAIHYMKTFIYLDNNILIAFVDDYFKGSISNFSITFKETGKAFNQGGNFE